MPCMFLFFVACWNGIDLYDIWIFFYFIFLWQYFIILVVLNKVGLHVFRYNWGVYFYNPLLWIFQLPLRSIPTSMMLPQPSLKVGMVFFMVMCSVWCFPNSFFRILVPSNKMTFFHLTLEPQPSHWESLVKLKFMSNNITIFISGSLFTSLP